MQVHPSQISPGEPFDIFYFVRNHTDATTYYVQAKVYDVKTGELLATHALTQSPVNARLHSKTIDAPPDPVGYGRNIVAIATVYTDSGFSTKSENYEEQEQYYLVKSVLPFAGVGGGGIDSRTVREIVQEELKTALDKLPKPEALKVPDAPDMSFVDALFGHFGVIERELGRVPKEGADLSAIQGSIDALKAQIDERPKFEPTDLSSLAEVAQNVLTRLESVARELKVGNGQVVHVFETALKNFATTFGEEIGSKIDDAVSNQEITLPLSFTPRSRKQPKEESPPDVSSLMR